MNALQTNNYIENSRHALSHLFHAINEYNKILSQAQRKVEEIEQSERALHDLFLYRDQFSNNANQHYGHYVKRMEVHKKSKSMAEEDIPFALEKALANIGASIESMSSLAGSVLQIAKQILSLRYGNKPSDTNSRKIGSQSIIDIIWEGRNHALHWEDTEARPPVVKMFSLLNSDFGIDVEYGINNCLSILEVLSWSSAENVIADLQALVRC